MSKKLALVLSTLLLVVTTFFGAAPASADITVKAGDLTAGGLQFNPPVVGIGVGETVTWVIGDLGPHNVVFLDAPQYSHDALEFAPGTSFSATFDAPGTYAYVCVPHSGAGMQGVVIVE